MSFIKIKLKYLLFLLIKKLTKNFFFNEIINFNKKFQFFIFFLEKVFFLTLKIGI